MRSRLPASHWAVDRGPQPDPAAALDARTLREAFTGTPAGVGMGRKPPRFLLLGETLTTFTAGPGFDDALED